MTRLYNFLNNNASNFKKYIDIKSNKVYNGNGKYLNDKYGKD